MRTNGKLGIRAGYLAQISTKIQTQHRLSIKEVMYYTYHRRCLRVAPGSHDARGFSLGTVMIRRSSVTVVCENGARNLRQKTSLVHLAVSGPSKESFGFYPHSRLLLKNYCIRVCSADEIQEQTEISLWLNTVVKVVEIELEQETGGNLRELVCLEEAGILGGEAARRLIEAYASDNPLHTV